MSVRHLLAVVAASVALIGAAACGGGSGSDAKSESLGTGGIEGVVVEPASGRSHVQGEPDYGGQRPPTGGNHNSYPLTCGYYSQQPPDEFAVHSLEHGAVWIAYDPDLGPADVEVLKQYAANSDHVLVTPYAGLATPVVVVSWEHRLPLQSVNDPRLAQFVNTFLNKGPEHAGCVGVGQPEKG
jgi:hypothetical protein